MKPGDLVEVYLNSFGERATCPTGSRKSFGTILKIFPGVTDPMYETLEVFVEGKLIWFYGGEYRLLQQET